MIEVRVESTAAGRLLATLSGQMPFAISKAINATAKDFQEEQRRGIARRFTLRRKTFVLRTVKINRGDFATKHKLEARVQIDPRRNILAKFELGGRKRPRRGKHVAVPIAVRRTRKGIVTRRQRPRAFHFERHVTARGKLQLKGERRTFIILRGRNPGIYQRLGGRRNSRVRLLYAFKRSVPISPDLEFISTGRRIIHERYAANLHKAIQFALRTAKRL